MKLFVFNTYNTSSNCLYTHTIMFLKQIKGLILGPFLLILLIHLQGYTQCPESVTGLNLVQNPGFEMGDTLFRSPLNSWDDPAYPPPGRWWSVPGEYWVHGVPVEFNADGQFSGTPHTGSKMMLVDAKCEPGQTIWEQDLKVKPGTNYYFSVWISTLKIDAPARLKFEVNGVTLGEEVNAPSVKNSWLFYEDVWYSDTMDGIVTLRIKEQNGVGCEDGDDFALDDISFIPGCEFGAPGPEPSLGPDFALCGTGGIATLNSGLIEHPDVNIMWNTGDTTSSISVMKPGTYSVCVDSAGSCRRTDVIEVLDDYTISLGPDIDLCSPTSVTLDAGFAGPGVRYTWKKNDVVINGERSQTLFVNTPGTYVVEVFDPTCGKRSDEVQVTSRTLLATNYEFCPPSTAPLSVTGPGALAWYDQPEGGNKVATGNTYTTPVLNETTIYYVEDTTLFTHHVGPNTVFSGGYPGGNRADHSILFSVLNDLTLDSLTVYPVSWNDGTMTVGVTIYDITNGGNGTVVGTVNHSIPVVNNGGNPTIASQIPIGVQLEDGKRYRVTSEGTSGGQLFYHENGTAPTWPYTIDGIISLTGLGPSEGNPESYGYFYDWVVTSGGECDRVPVVAKAYCPPTCELPTDVSLAPTGPIDLCDGTEILTATATPVFPYLYEFFRNGVSVQGPTTANTLTVTEEGVYSVVISDDADPDVCFLNSSNVVIENTGLPEDPGPMTASLPTCSGADVVYSIDPVKNAESYAWTVPDGSQIIGDADGNSITVRIGNTSGYVKVTPVNTKCGSGKPDSILVTVDSPSDDAGPVSGDPIPCAGSTATYTVDPVNNADTYTWDVPEGATIVSPLPTGNSVQVQFGDTIGYVKVTPSNSICGAGKADSVLVNVTKPADDAASIDGSARGCIGLTGTYSVSGIENAAYYEWTVPNGSSIEGPVDGSSIVVRFGTTSGNITVTPKNDICGDGAPASIFVEMNDTPGTADLIVAPEESCSDIAVTYTVSDVQYADSYQWEVPEGAVVSSSGATVNITFGGESGYVKVTPVGYCAEGEPDSVFVDVTPSVTPTISISDPGFVCEGSPATFTAIPQYAGLDPHYEWFVNGVAQGVDATVYNSSFIEPGDIVQVELRSSEECILEDTARGYVTISGFGAGISIDTTACAPDSVILVAGGGLFYHWYKEPGIDLFVENDTLIVKESGVYYATVSAGQCTRTVRREVEIFTPPIMQIDPQVTQINLGESFFLKVNPLIGERGFRYAWMNMNETVLSTDSTLSGTPIYLNGGEEKYQLEVTDTNGCKVRDTAIVLIIRVPLVIPNLITANGDNKNDALVIQGLTPNSKIKIYNRWGALVYQSDNYDNSWSGEGVSDSIYYYHITMGITDEEHKGWVHVVN